MKKMLLNAAAAVLALAAMAGSANAELAPVKKANAELSAAYDKYAIDWAALDAVFDPLFADIDQTIRQLEANGLDPHSYSYVYKGVRYSSIIEAEATAKVDRNDARGRLNTWYENREAGIIDERDETLKDGEIVQGATDLVSLPTLIAAEVLFGDAGRGRIDTYEIVENGKFFGGSNSAVNAARRDVIRTVTFGAVPDIEKDNGEIAKVIRDPIKCTVGHLFGKCK